MNHNVPLFDSVNPSVADQPVKANPRMEPCAARHILALLIRNHKKVMAGVPASQQFWPYFKGIAGWIEFKELCRSTGVRVSRDTESNLVSLWFGPIGVYRVFKWKDYPFQ